MHKTSISDGFSLIETLIVLVVLGFVLGFTGVKFDSYRIQLRIQNQARLVQVLLQRVQLQNAANGLEAVVDDALIARLLAANGSDASETAARVVEAVVATVVTPLYVAADGSCSTGRIDFSLREFVYALEIAAPLCNSSVVRVK